MKELPLNALRALAAVHAHGGVRAAARELGVAHSSISRHLLELEQWLGVPVARPAGGRRGLQWTPQGEHLAAAARAAFGELAEAASALRETRSPFAVTLSTSPSFATRWLLPRLPSLQRAHPRIALSVLVEQRVEALADGGVDLAVRMGGGPWRGVHAEPLMDETLFPVMSPAAWEAAGRPRQTHALRDLRLLHDRDPQAGWERWLARYGPEGLDLADGPRFASSDLVLRAATLGQGVALARGRLADDDLRAGLLVRPFGDDAVTLGTSYWIVRPPQLRPPRTALRAVIDWLKSEAG